MTSSKVANSPPPRGYSPKFIGVMVILIAIGVLNMIHIFDLIAYTRDNKPNDDFELKDFSSFWVTALGSLILYVIEYSYKHLTS